jgi:hypothetical protein
MPAALANQLAISIRPARILSTAAYPTQNLSYCVPAGPQAGRTGLQLRADLNLTADLAGA